MGFIKGVITALATPFDQNGEINLDAFRTHIRLQKQAQVAGIAILGTTGEAPTLTHEERSILIKVAKEETQGSLHLMVGTGSYSTRSAIQMTSEAFEMGADSALVVAPYYNKPPQEGLCRHFQEIARQSRGPIVIYNIPGRCMVNVDNSTIMQLLDEQNVAAIKECTGNVPQAQELIFKAKQKRPDVSILSGDDSGAIPLIAMGGDGLISVASNIIPKEIVLMTTYALTSRFKEAREILAKYFPLIQSLFIKTNPIPLKCAMNMMGLMAGPVRLPLTDLSQPLVNELKKELETLHLIKQHGKSQSAPQELKRELSFSRD
ncbi:4-hydroxy-tetrahydrodipicolinate synthase [Estrella lausannensis]|uniref:4-hydroxy-tetrahydrodipicolinate synthase n=1 Tax=Estrella lausannensis TaxID=483423 RepID=A0A0H5DSY3_9BACT|nr:4-hydroxy-tetrahydrodipicolinate synthase [Estrella lausannensis]CRX39448.1 Dihydrodipicolinate synthase [Estrella lausannensis]